MIISIPQLEVFFFILARISGVFLQAPFFSSRTFPAPVKIVLVVWISIVLWFVTPVFPALPAGLLPFLLTLAAEVALGFLIGFACNLIFLAVQSAGEIIDLQMGLSVASALDPTFGSVVSIIGRLTSFIALLVFIILNGHHLILSAFHQSFSLLPAGKIANFVSDDLASQVIALSVMFWMTTIKLALPIVLLIFLSDFTFGIVSRVAPQVNVFMLGFQVKPTLGLFGLALMLPLIIRYIGTLIATMGQELTRLFMIVK